MKKKPLQIAAWLAAMALALAIAVRLWSTAFPVAAVPVTLTRTQVAGRLADFVHSTGIDLTGCRNAVEFGEDTEPKNFIERQYGPQRLAQAAASGVNIWYWTARWFKPEQHEEFNAWADQTGNIVGFQHTIEEERALPTLTQPQARTLAEDFLKTHITQHPLSALKYLESSTDQRPHRTDYTFTWEQSSLRMGDAPYHLDVTVQGNQIGSYGEYLKVPEWWSVQFDRDRAVNNLCYRIATFTALAIIIGLLVLFFLGIRGHQIRWLGAVPWGWLVLFAIVEALTQINNVPSLIFTYPTTQKWSPFVAGAIFSAARSIIGAVFLFWLLLVIADFLYRQRIVGKSSFRRALGTQALRDPQTVRALGVGIAFATFSLAYVCLFYAAGQRLGVWCPVEIDYSKTMSGPFPWVEGLQTGLTACFSEEMLFRVGAIVLFWRIFRVRWLAVLLAAASWGFLHSNYAQMPGYIRGVELTIVGIIWGSLMLRYGIIATLTAHYLYDCWLVNLVSFPGESWGNKACAIAVSVWPIALFLWALARPGTALEAEETHLLPPPEISKPTPREWLHVPLGLGRRGLTLLFIGSLAGLAVVLFLPRPQNVLNQFGKLDLSRVAIIDKADAQLRQLGYSPDGYQKVTSVYGSYLPVTYMLEHGTLAQLAQVNRDDFPDLTWSVRYFRFMQPEEFRILLDQHGRFLTWNHIVLRETPGAALDEPDAIARARNTLAAISGIAPDTQQLISESPTQQEHRRDWRFAFDEKNFAWGDAKLRTYIRVQGSEALALVRTVKVPDAWLIEHAKRGWKQFVSGEFKSWTSLALAAILAVLLVLAIRRHLIPWQKSFLYALFPLALTLADQLNHAPQFYASYDTTVPRPHYLISQFGSRAESLVLTYLAGVITIGIALGFLHWAWSWTPDQLVLWPADKKERGNFWRDTLLVTFAGVIAFWLLALLNLEILGHFWPAEVASVTYWSVDESMPWLGATIEALNHGYHELIRLAILASVFKLLWNRYPRAAWVVLFLFPLMNLGVADTLGGFVWGLIYAEASLLLAAALILRVWRFNAAAIFLTYTMSAYVSSITLFLKKGGPTYSWQSTPMIALILIPIAAGYYLHHRQSPQPPTPDTA